MTHDDAQAREDLDILLTAYALGELSGADQAAVERLLADPAAADARAHVAEVRGAAAALKALREQELPERSADLRKAVLTAAVGRGAVTPAEAPQAGRRGGIGKWILSLGSCAAVAAVSLFFSRAPKASLRYRTSRRWVRKRVGTRVRKRGPVG